MQPEPEIDETLLTAYALGELDEQERLRVDYFIAGDASARQFVRDVRETAKMVTDEFERESFDGLAGIQRAVIEQRMRALSRPGTLRPATAFRWRWQWLPVAASLAASLLIVGIALAFLLPRLYPTPVASDPQPGKATAPSGPEVAVIGPSEQIPQPDLREPEQQQPAPSDITPPQWAQEGTADARLDDEAVEGMVDPAEWQLNQQAMRAEEPIPAAPSKDQPAPANEKVAEGPAVSPEAEKVSTADRNKPDAGRKPDPRDRRARVNVSPVRDPAELERIVKKNAEEEAANPRVYENPFRPAAERPKSAFPVRVEASSYRFIRTQLMEGRLPPADRVRIEELVNRFGYRYAPPAEGDAPIAVNVEIARCPWNAATRLARVAIKARDGGSTIVARGVRVSVEFNPVATNSWRLIGYENAPAPTSHSVSVPFDMAAGGAATAFYEIQPASATASARDLFTVTVSYRLAQDAAEQTIELTATDTGSGFDRATEDFRFAAAVAAFGMVLRDSQFKGTASHASVIRWATAAKGRDETGDRAAFIDLAKRARDLSR